MELPFAVESQGHDDDRLPSSDDASLVTASSQGSLLQSESSYDPIQAADNYPKNNHDIVSSPEIVVDQSPLVSQAAAAAAVPHRFASVLSHFGVTNTTKNSSGTASTKQQTTAGHRPLHHEVESEVIDFTYVNVCETDADEVDIILAGAENAPDGLGTSDGNATRQRGDILTILLSGPAGSIQEEAKLIEEEGQDYVSEKLANLTQQGHLAASAASKAKQNGNLKEALDAHTAAAKYFQQGALLIRAQHDSLAKSLIMLSQMQAKSALGLQRVIKLRPNSLAMFKEKVEQKERLRETVRGALSNRTEADISDSIFLGRATTDTRPVARESQEPDLTSAHLATSPTTPNPVDEMLELERELRNMDMMLEMGNSIASLDTRSQNRMKSSAIDGSFMVVPPGSNSFMSSSTMWSQQQAPSRTTPNHSSKPTSGPTSAAMNARVRANRVQNMLDASMLRPGAPAHGVAPRGNGLESSWWGNSSAASQVLTSSVISLASGTGNDALGNQPAHTKQLMRLMDSLKALGDENAALLREVEDAEAARREARAAKEQMRLFKEDYGKRFASLKEALEKFRKGYPQHNGTEPSPVASSEILRSTTTAEQLQRQEQLILKLTTDLNKAKSEIKKKDAALRKYENFYREVKTRSAQKAALRKQKDRVGGFVAR